MKREAKSFNYTFKIEDYFKSVMYIAIQLDVGFDPF